MPIWDQYNIVSAKFNIMKKVIIILILCASVLVMFGQQKPLLSFSTEFEGGNGFIEKISNDSIWITPDTRNIVGDWFYWAIEVTSDTECDLTFCLPPYKIPAFGVAFSYDGGVNWSWSKMEEDRYIQTFTMYFTSNKPVRLSMGFPYTNSNWQKFVSKLDKGAFRIETLCVSSKNEPVPMMLFENNENAVSFKPKIVITARHHACEMMTNYVLEGMITSFVKDDQLKSFLELFDVLIIPFVDYDGVQNGDQGKNRYPRDHNRDYSGESIYTTTKAIRDYLPMWAQDNLYMAIDLHCPGILGKEHEFMHIVGSKTERYANAEMMFAAHLAEHTSDNKLMFDETSILKYGTSWNNDRSEIQGDSFKTWCQKQFPNSKLSCSFEVPYANSNGEKITAENLKDFGKAMTYAISDFLKEKSKSN